MTTPDDPGSHPHAADDLNLTAQTVKGVRWSYVSTGGGALIQLGFAVIVSRILAEEAFGLIAVAQFGLRFASYFARMGVSQALIQKRVLSDDDIRAGVTSGTVLGLGFVALFWFLAPYAPVLFTEVGRELADELVLVVRLMSLTILFAGMQMTAQALLQRSLRFKELALIDLSSYVLGYYVLGLAIAFTTGGVEALIVANLSQWVIQVVACYARTRHPIRPILRWGAYRELYGFGGKVSLTGVFEFTSENLDTAAIARYEGAGPAGTYNRAYTLVALPMYYLTNSLNDVLFPGFSRMTGQMDRIKRTYLSSVSFSASFLWPTCAGIAVASDQIVHVVLGPGWEDVIVILPVITLATAMHFLSTLNGVVVTADARLNEKLVIEVVYLAFLACLMAVAVGRGTVAYASALAAGEVIRHAVYVVLMQRLYGVTVGDHLRSYWRAAATAGTVAGTIGVVRYVLHTTAGLPELLVLLAEVGAGAATMVANLRGGFLRPMAADLRARLATSRMVEEGTAAGRLSAVVLGSPARH